MAHPNFFMMINGSPKGFFPAQRGLRQANPRSPFLFVIMGEAVSRMIGGAENAHLMAGFKEAIEFAVCRRHIDLL